MAETSANSIALILKYAPDVFDDVYRKESTSSILAKNNADIQFTGVKTIKVAKRQFGGLYPYHRNNIGDARVDGTMPFGYQASKAGLTWEEHTLEMDRAAYYPIETFDNEESGGKIVGTSITYIDQYILVPEIDAYCWSKIYEKAGVHVVAGETAPDGFSGADPIAKPLETLHMCFKWEADHEIPENDQVVIASTSFQVALQQTQEFGTTRFVDFGKEADKDLAFNVVRYQGRKIVIVPPLRFQNKYNFDGNGFWPEQDAVGIDLMVMPLSAATHIVKYEKTRILEGDVATAMTHLDGYVILTRIYHDVIVFDNKRVAIVAIAGFADAAGKGSTVKDNYTFTLDAKHILKRAIFEKGDVYTVLAQGLVSGTDYNATTKEIVSSDNVHGKVLATGQVVTGPIQVLRVNQAGKLALVKEVAVTDTVEGETVWLTIVKGTIA